MGILDALCDLEVVDFIDALGHLVDKIVPKPQLLERDMRTPQPESARSPTLRPMLRC